MTDAMMTSVGAVLQRIEAGRSTKTLERPAKDGELGILRVSAVTWGEFRPGENKAMPLDYDPGNVPRPMKGDILISRANTRELVGAPVMVEADHPNLLLSDKILRLVPDCNIVVPRYLVRALRSSIASSHFSQCAGGTSGSMTNITQGDIRATPLRLPSLPEQRRIAAILDKADALRAKRREAIAKLDQLLQSVFLEMFGDPERNPKGWPQLALGTICRNEDSKRKPIKKTDREERDGPYPYYGASGIIDSFDDYIFDGERLLVAEDGANLVMRSTPVAFIARGQYWVNNHAHVLAESDDADLRFIEQALLLMNLKPYITGSAQPKLNQSNLERILLPMPPVKLQKRFREICEKLESEKQHLVSQNHGVDFLFHSLQQRAFDGTL